MELTKNEAEQLARRRHLETGDTYEIWEHIGDYGRPDGDIPATHRIIVVRQGSRPDLPWWAVIAIFGKEDRDEG